MGQKYILGFRNRIQAARSSSLRITYNLNSFHADVAPPKTQRQVYATPVWSLDVSEPFTGLRLSIPRCCSPTFSSGYLSSAGSRNCSSQDGYCYSWWMGHMAVCSQYRWFLQLGAGHYKYVSAKCYFITCSLYEIFKIFLCGGDGRDWFSLAAYQSLWII